LIPEIGASLVAATDAIDVNKVKELIEKNAEKKVLVTALKAIEAAYKVKQQVELPMKKVQMDLTVSIPPKVTVSFLND
jgi:hypothetical protein